MRRGRVGDRKHTIHFEAGLQMYGSVKKDGDISRLGRFISRLGRGKFPVSPATEIGSQALDKTHYFPGQTGPAGRNSRAFRGTGNCPKSGRGGTSRPVATASRRRR